MMSPKTTFYFIVLSIYLLSLRFNGPNVPIINIMISYLHSRQDGNEKEKRTTF